MLINLQLDCPIHDSFRVQQVLGMFDIPHTQNLREHFSVEVPALSDSWQIGMIVGPSGSGKTSIARAAFGENLYAAGGWPADRAVIDGFGDLPIRMITQALTAVGFSSPPAWVKPYAVLSNGEKFRCDLARALLSASPAPSSPYSGERAGVSGDLARALLSASPAPSPLYSGERAGVRGGLSSGVASFTPRAARPLTLPSPPSTGERESMAPSLEMSAECQVLSAEEENLRETVSQRIQPADRTQSPALGHQSAPLKTESPAQGTSLVVFDEFTSVVDRTVARIGSAAISRAIRSGKIAKRFVAVTCHYDVIPWLRPDWIIDMATQTVNREPFRDAPTRPTIRLDIRRCDRQVWSIFRRHHYLSGGLHRSAQCFAGYIDDRPAVFTAVLPFPHPRRPGWREHRTVCLPDFQGVGIGSAMAAYIASLFVATGKPYFSTSSHPAVIHHRMNSPLWRMTRRPGMVSQISPSGAGKTGMEMALSLGRFTAGFEYVGPVRIAEAKVLRVV